MLSRLPILGIVGAVIAWPSLGEGSGVGMDRFKCFVGHDEVGVRVLESDVPLEATRDDRPTEERRPLSLCRGLRSSGRHAHVLAACRSFAGLT